MKIVLKTYGLSIGYRQGKGKTRMVYQNIGQELASGELTCLLGPNGCGKSTLIRTFAGFQPPLEGNVLIAGKPVNRYKPKELARKLSVVLTEHPPTGNMSVFAMVAFGRMPYTGFVGKLTPADKSVVRMALHLAGITELRNRSFHSLSDGEKQKVFIAKSLAQQTPVLLLDEPTAFLDFPGKIEILRN